MRLSFKVKTFQIEMGIFGKRAQLWYLRILEPRPRPPDIVVTKVPNKMSFVNDSFPVFFLFTEKIQKTMPQQFCYFMNPKQFL